jgi:DNA repair protein RadC
MEGMPVHPCELRILPRQELIAYGADRVSSQGLVAILLGSGSKEQSAIELAAILLRSSGGILGLSQASAVELCAIDGIGEALATRIVASFQLGRRALEAGLPNASVVRGPEEVYNRLRGRLGALTQEIFMVLALDVRGRVIDEIEVARGTLAGVEVHPREVFRPLIRRSAFACVVAHNHPSGDPTPSAEDYQLSERLQAVGRLVGIELLDHVVIASGGYCSMADRLHGGLLSQEEGQIPETE